MCLLAGFKTFLGVWISTWIPTTFKNFQAPFLINHENTSHRTFLSDDTLFCYLCKLKRHTSKHCKFPPSKSPNIKIYEAPAYKKSYSNSNVTDYKIEIHEPICDTLEDPKVDTKTTSIPRTSILPSLLDALLSLEVTTKDSILFTPFITNAKN